MYIVMDLFMGVGMDLYFGGGVESVWNLYKDGFGVGVLVRVAHAPILS